MSASKGESRACFPFDGGGWDRRRALNIEEGGQAEISLRCSSLRFILFTAGDVTRKM